MKKLLIALALTGVTIFGIYGFIIPNILEGRVPQMKQFLNDTGYKNAKMTKINGFLYQVSFKTDKGNVNVVTTRNGGFAIRY